MVARKARVSGGGKTVAEKPRIVYFDILRAVAPLFVVFIHAAVTFHSHSLKIHFVQEIGRWAVPIFFMISGALLLDPKKPFDIKKFYLKNIKRLVIALVFWVLVYATLFMFFGDRTENHAYYFGLNMMGGNAYHLWFMFSLIAVYVLMPILRCISRDEKVLGYSVLMGVIVCFALPLIDSIIRIIAYTTNCRFLMGYVDGGLFFEKISWELRTFSLVVYFLLGYFLAKWDFSKKMRWAIYGLGIVSWLVDFLWIIVGERVLHMESAANYYFLPVLCFSAAIFLFARYATAKVKKLPWILSFMAKHSFGVYLCHLAILLFFLKKIEVFDNGVLMMLLGTLATYVLSLILSWLMSLIPVVKKVV